MRKKIPFWATCKFLASACSGTSEVEMVGTFTPSITAVIIAPSDTPKPTQTRIPPSPTITPSPTLTAIPQSIAIPDIPSE